MFKIQTSIALFLQRAKTYLEQYKARRQLFSTNKTNSLELNVNDKIYLKIEALKIFFFSGKGI